MNSIHGMGTSEAYDWAVLILSVAAIALALAYLWRVIEAYRIYHDDRATVSLVKAVGLFVIAIGLSISAGGLVLDYSELAIVGLTLARGALIVTLFSLVLAKVRPVGRD
jgi:hypothetical protein